MGENDAKVVETILVVEDDEGLRQLIIKNLERAGFKTVTASNGEETIARIKNYQNSLLLLDYLLPDMTGKKIVENIIEKNLEIPFIVMTGKGDEKTVVEMMKLGARDYIVKDARFIGLLPQVVSRVVEQLSTERRLEVTETKLRESQQSLFNLMGNLPGMAYRCLNDSKRTMTFVSDGCIDLTGYHPSDLLDKDKISYIELVHEDDRDMVLYEIQSACEEKRPFQIVYRIHSANNKEKWVWEKGSGVYSHEGEFKGLEGFISDITERKQAEDNLKKSKKALEDANLELATTNLDLELSIRRTKEMVDKAEAANRAKSEFLANVSHEVRTPLNSIIGMINLVLNSKLDSEQSRYLKMSRSSAYSLLEIINNILDFSKAEAGKILLEKVEFNITETINRFIGPLSCYAQKKDLKLLMNIDPDVPPILIGDPTKLRQVIVNLIGNSIKFTEKGEIELHICVEEITSSGKVKLHVSVRDTGIGVSEEKKEVIFESFTQADGSTTRKYGGTGLGLAISKKLVELMDGEIWVESKVGKESTFHFTTEFEINSGLLKSEASADLNDVISRPISEIKSEDEHDTSVRLSIEELKGLKVLLAEDNEVNQILETEILKKRGLKPVLVENGLQAVEKFKEEEFDLILMDVQMPEMSGTDATMRIREIEDETGGHIPIVALTAHAMNGDRERFLNDGMDDYVSKPIKEEELVEVISRCVKIRDTLEGGLSQEAKNKKNSGLKPEWHDQEIFDIDELLDLVSGNKELAYRVIETYQKNLPIKIGNLEEAIRRKDFARIEEIGHDLKGSSGNISAEGVKKASSELENAALEKSIDKVQNSMLKLKEELDKLLCLIDKQVAVM